MRPLAFICAALASVAAVGLLNWWVDPYTDRYAADAVAAALARTPGCFVSHVVVPEQTWPEFKLDVFRDRRPHTVVVGTSRVWKLAAASPDEPFANLSLPGMGPETVLPLFERLAARSEGALTVYLGLDSLWFSGNRGQRYFDEPIRDRVRRLLSGQTLRATVGVLSRAPGAIRDPRSLAQWSVSEFDAGCLVDRGQSVLGGAANAWAPDGTWHWQWDLTGAQVPPAKPFVVTNRRSFTGDTLDAENVAQLERALAFAREQGWRVVGFAPPFTTESLRLLASDPATSPLLRDFRRRMPLLFARHGFTFVDLSDVSRVPCDERQFTWNDGAHVDDECSRRLRERLERSVSGRG